MVVNFPDRDKSVRDFEAAVVRTSTDLGRVIRRRRKALGLDIIAAASACGIGVRFLSELERGKATAQIGRTLQVMQRLGIEVAARPRGDARMSSH